MENLNRVDSNLRMDFHNNGSNEWLGFRLELIGSVFLCCSALFMVILPSSIVKPGKSTQIFLFLSLKIMSLTVDFCECRVRGSVSIIWALSQRGAFLRDMDQLLSGE